MERQNAAAPIQQRPTNGISEMNAQMTAKKIDAIPVVKGLRLVGLVTTTDLLTLLLEDHGEPEPLPFEYRLIEDARAYS